MKRHSRLAVVAALALALPALGASAQGSYTVTDLGVLPGSAQSQGLAISTNGQVAGYCWQMNGVTYHGFVYTGTLPLLDIPAFTSSGWSIAYGVNAYGDSVGRAQTAKSSRAFLWHAGKLTDITLKDLSSASAVNDSGVVVGTIVLSAGQTARPFRWQNGVWSYLPQLSKKGTWGVGVVAINGAGLIAGTDIDTDGSQRAVIWSGSTVTRLPLPAGCATSQATGLSSAGDIVGKAPYDGSNGHDWLWPDGASAPVALPAGFGANGVNSAGQVIGGYTAPDGSSYPAIWDGGTVYNLNSMLDPVSGQGWVLEAALAINDSGQITGRGRINGGTAHAYLLTPQ